MTRPTLTLVLTLLGTVGCQDTPPAARDTLPIVHVVCAIGQGQIDQYMTRAQFERLGFSPAVPCIFEWGETFPGAPAPVAAPSPSATVTGSPTADATPMRRAKGHEGVFAMGLLNGVQHPNGHDTDFIDDLEEAVATPSQLKDLTEKVDDVRASVASMGVLQATTSGDVRVLSAKFDGLAERMEDRIEKLEEERSTERANHEWRSWVERLLYAGVGAGVLELARTLLSR